MHGDYSTYLLLRVTGLSAHVREEGDVVKLEQSRVDIRLVWVHVDTCRRELARLEGSNERGFIDHGSSCRVDEDRSLLHLVELGFTERSLGLVVKRQVEGNDVRLGQQVVGVVDVGAREVGCR